VRRGKTGKTNAAVRRGFHSASARGAICCCYKIAAILDRQRAAIESVDFEARIARLETLVVEEGEA
jgi:hypothetical protein